MLEDDKLIPSIPVNSQGVPFRPVAMFKRGGHERNIVLGYLLFACLIIPMGILTRIFEWTGIELSLAGTSVYLTLYLPMVFCVPLVIWMGFWWAAIPAYFSTFTVALLGGMPLEWIPVFALANPIGLGLYALAFRVTPNINRFASLEAFVSFVVIALIASLAGSVGAFIWAITNNVGLNNAYPVWQGWWLGGWLQAICLALPIICVFNKRVNRILAPVIDARQAPNDIQRMISIASLSFVLVMVSYVYVARLVGMDQFTTVAWTEGATMERAQVVNLIDSLSYPLFILLAVMMALAFLGYRAVITWHRAMVDVQRKLTVTNKRLVDMVDKDALSDVFNRRKLFDLLQTEFSKCRRGHSPVSLIMIDADNFKSINDNYGHLAGDEVIRAIGEVLKSSIRPYDAAGRYGGEEFLVMLPGTSVEMAAIIAERIRTKIEHKSIVSNEQTISVTVSLGVAEYQASDANMESLVERADMALLQAKTDGRNKVILG